MKRPYLLFCLGVLCLSWTFPPWVGRSGLDLGFGFLLDPPITGAKIDLVKLLLLDLSICACLAISYGVWSSVPKPVAWRVVIYGPLIALLGLAVILAATE